ncbi:unnamed protein product [Boreogadus saida]
MKGTMRCNPAVLQYLNHGQVCHDRENQRDETFNLTIKISSEGRHEDPEVGTADFGTDTIVDKRRVGLVTSGHRMSWVLKTDTGVSQGSSPA